MQPAIHVPQPTSLAKHFAGLRRQAQTRMARAAELFTTFSAKLPPPPVDVLPPIPAADIEMAHELLDGARWVVGEVERIQRATLKQYPDVSMKDLRSQRRFKLIVRARQVAMYVAKEETERSYPDLGRRFGNRDHTTVLHAHRKIKKLIETDAALAEKVHQIRRSLSDAGAVS